MLVLAFPDPYSLWAELVHPRAERVFVPTGEDHRIGTALTVGAALPGITPNVVLNATVVGQRPPSERFPQGLFVRLEPKELEKCRALLGLLPQAAGPETGRRTPRVDCTLALRFAVPNIAALAEAKNLSETGMLAKVSYPLTVGQRASVRLTLDDGTELSLNTEVSWSRPELSLVGMELLSPDRASLDKLVGCILRLRAGTGPERSKLIVVADDDPVCGELFTSTLVNARYPVKRAYRGDEALQMVRRLRPRMLILDVLLPAMDGKDVCKRIRADAEMLNTQVLLASGLERGTLHSVAQECGATDYLGKPVDPADLLSMVRRYAGKP